MSVPFCLARLVRALFVLEEHAALEVGPGELPIAETRHRERLDSALTAFVPTPFRPTLN